MDTTLNPKQTDPRHVMVARADEELAHAYEQITHADEQIARAEEQLSKLERKAARHPGNRPLFDRPVVRGLTGVLLAACIFITAFVSQSPYGDATKLFIARWAPQLILTSSLPMEKRIEQLKASQEQMAADNAKAVEQLKASQEQMTRLIAKASEQNLRPKTSAPPPRPIASPTRKPVPKLPSPQARAQPRAPTPLQPEEQ